MTIVLLTWLTATSAELPLEAPLPSGAKPLAERGRFSAIQTYDETIAFYHRALSPSSNVRWQNIVSMPGIKAKHVSSLRKKTRWDGINIYEKQGEVRIYVLRRQPVDLPTRP